MDPVSAIGVAAAIVQFVDFSFKILKTFKEIRDDEQSATRSNKEFEQAARDLERYRTQLGSSSPSGQTDRRIIKVAGECARIATELIDLLDHVKGGGSKIGKAKATWRAMLKRKPIDELWKRLEAREAILDKLLIQDTNVSVKRLRKEMQEQNLKSAESIQRLSRTLQAETLKAVGSAKESLHKRFDALELESQRYRDVTRQEGDGERFLQSLFFAELDQRRSSIRNAYPGTFRWIFTNYETRLDAVDEDGYSVAGSEDEDEDEERLLIQRPEPSQTEFYTIDKPSATDSEDEGSTGYHRPRYDDLSHWLREEDDVYWISGKAGSGKSTLMAYIMEHECTKQELRTWGQGSELVMLSFFFWRAGSSLQQSVIGLLRGLLYQLCRACLKLIPYLLADMQCSAALLPTWTESRLTNLIKTAIRMVADHRICIFIDGLDEFTGPYEELVNLMFELQAFEHVKCCVSSRPEIELADALAACHGLQLQDLNEQDIKTLVRDKLAPLGLAKDDIESLTRNVTDRSEGIFLWAAFVTQSLVRGVKSGDELVILNSRLDQLPRDLDKLFMQMFQRIDKVHRKSLAFYLQVARLAQEPTGSGQVFTSIANVTTARYLSNIDSYERFAQYCRQVETQVVAQSAGLLEVIEKRNGVYGIETWEQAQRVYLVLNWIRGTKGLSKGDLGRREALDHPVPYPDVLRFEQRHIGWIHRSAYDFVFPMDGAPSPFDFDSQDLPKTLYQIGQGAAKYVAVAPSYPILWPFNGTTRIAALNQYRIKALTEVLEFFQRGFKESTFSILDTLYQSVSELHPDEASWTKLTDLLGPAEYPSSPVTVFWRYCSEYHGEYVLTHLQSMSSDLNTPTLAVILRILTMNLLRLDVGSRTLLRLVVESRTLLRLHRRVMSMSLILEMIMERLTPRGISDGQCARQENLLVDLRNLQVDGDPVVAPFVVSCFLMKPSLKFEERYGSIVYMCLTNACIDWRVRVSSMTENLRRLSMDSDTEFYKVSRDYEQLIYRMAEEMACKSSVLPRQRRTFTSEHPGQTYYKAHRLVLLATWQASCTLRKYSLEGVKPMPEDLLDGLTIICMPHPMRIVEESAWRPLVEVQKYISLQLKPEVVSRLLGLLHHDRYAEYSYCLRGIPGEIKALYDMMVAQIWENEGKLSSTDQLIALACVQTGFEYWLFPDDDFSRYYWRWLRTFPSDASLS